MDITLLYFEDCPNWKVADERLSAIAAERADIRLTRHLVETPPEAERTCSTAHPASWSTAWTSSPSPAPRSGSPVAGTSHRTGTRAHRRSNSCRRCWPMRERIATIGPIAAVAGAFGLCCGLPLLLSMGVVGAVAGWSLQSWALIGVGLALA